MLLIFLLFLTTTGVLSTIDDCGLVTINLKGREQKSILSPKYPKKLPGDAHCKWNVIAEEGRRVIVVCPLKLQPPDAQGPSCQGQFTITPDGANATTHCTEKGFSRIGQNNRMVIMFNNILPEPLDGFKCYVYAEQNIFWETIENYIAPDEYSYTIFMDEGETTQLTPPNRPEVNHTGSNLRWIIVGPVATHVRFHCPFTNRPPAPVTAQPSPCNGRFMIFRGGPNITRSCETRAWKAVTRTHWAVFHYENVRGPPDDHFICYATLEPNIATPKPEKRGPFSKCDHIFDLASGQIIELVSRNYPEPHLYPYKFTCRWTILAPEGRTIVLSMGMPLDLGNGKCLGALTVITAGNNETVKCWDNTFARNITGNWVILLYNLERNRDTPPWKMFATAKQKSPNYCQACPITDKHTNTDCDYVMFLQKKELKQFTRDDFPIDEDGNCNCRYTFIAPSQHHIILANFAPTSNASDIMVKACTSQYIIYTEGPDETFHCTDRIFSRTSAFDRLVFVYRNKGGMAKIPFETFIYTEEQLTQNEEEDWTQKESDDACSYSLETHSYDLVDLKSLNRNKAQPNTTCEWKIEAPKDSRVLVVCKMNLDKKPSRKGVCNIRLKVFYAGHPAFYCIDKSFLRVSHTRHLLLVFDNLSEEPVESHHCKIGTELVLNPNFCENCPYLKPYKDCDNLFNMTNNEMRVLKQPEEVWRQDLCRWTIVVPEDSEVLLHCPIKNNKSPDKCRSRFTVLEAGKESKICRENDVMMHSVSNWMIVIVPNTPFSYKSYSSFVCYAYAEKKLPTNCTDCSRADYSKCDVDLKIELLGANYKLENPDFPYVLPAGVPCRWTIHSPPFTELSIMCPDYHEEKLNWDDRCKGFFTIYDKSKGPIYQCRHQLWSYFTHENELNITYNNALGVSRDGIRCYVTGTKKVCDSGWHYLKLKYDDHFKLPIWEHENVPDPPCNWTIQAPPDSQVYLDCPTFNSKITGHLWYSPIGDRHFQNATRHNLGEIFRAVSINNTMTISYDIYENLDPWANDRSIGCVVFIEKKKTDCVCGKHNRKVGPNGIGSSTRRILNGTYTQPYEYPMMAAIAEMHTHQIICGATIISEYFALTAAHCSYATSFLPRGLVTGIHDLGVDAAPWYDINAWDVFPHFLEAQDKLYDIALVGVKTPIEFNIFVEPVCLPFNFVLPFEFIDESVTALGWGYLKASSDPSGVGKPHGLAKAVGKILPDAKCKSMMKPYKPDQHFCIQFSSQVTCTHDAGGPVLWKNKLTGRLVLVGVTVYSQNCLGPPYISVAMEALTFLNWIEERLPNVTFCQAG